VGHDRLCRSRWCHDGRRRRVDRERQRSIRAVRGLELDPERVLRDAPAVVLRPRVEVPHGVPFGAHERALERLVRVVRADEQRRGRLAQARDVEPRDLAPFARREQGARAHSPRRRPHAVQLPRGAPQRGLVGRAHPRAVPVLLRQGMVSGAMTACCSTRTNTSLCSGRFCSDRDPK